MASIASFDWLNHLWDSYFSSEATDETAEEAEAPTSTVPPVAERVDQQWTVQMTESGRKNGLPEILNNAAYHYQINADYRPPSPTKHFEVARDRYVTTSAKGPKPYVSNVDSAIIVQMRGSDRQGNPKTLGLAHVATSLQPLKNSIEEMLKLSEGTVEIFITGGKSHSEKNYQAIRHYIECVQKVHKSRIQLKDDYFRATDLGVWIQNPKTPLGKAQIKRSGFDLKNNPFMILDYTKAQNIKNNAIKI